MFLAVSMDDNNQILPIGFGVGKIEVGGHGYGFYQDLRNILETTFFGYHIRYSKFNWNEHSSCVSEHIMNIDFVLGGCKSLPRV